MKALTLILLVSFSSISFAQQTLKNLSAELTSQEKSPLMIELFTSEGCHSCPRADKWLRQLNNTAGLWTEYVPMAFHVDYWNYLGWKDRFASPSNTNRQRQYRRDGQVNSVYTPGFVVSGEEWRGWFSNPSLQTVLDRVPRPNVDKSLSLNVKNGYYRLSFDGDESEIGGANIVLLGMGIKSDVRSGENRGRKLEHDFVVLDWQKLDNQTNRWSGFLNDQFDSEVSSYAIVGWVENPEINKPQKIVAGFLSSPGK